MQCVWRSKVSDVYSRVVCVYNTSVHMCGATLFVRVCICACIEARETEATAGRHMAHMSSRSTGTLCRLEPVGEHAATSFTTANRMWLLCDKRWFPERRIHSCVCCPDSIRKNWCTHICAYANIQYTHCALCKAVPSYNWMQGPVTYVRKWDCDRVTDLISGLWGRQWDLLLMPDAWLGIVFAVGCFIMRTMSEQ